MVQTKGTGRAVPYCFAIPQLFRRPLVSVVANELAR